MSSQFNITDVCFGFLSHVENYKLNILKAYSFAPGLTPQILHPRSLKCRNAPPWKIIHIYHLPFKHSNFLTHFPISYARRVLCRVFYL